MVIGVGVTGPKLRDAGRKQWLKDCNRVAGCCRLDIERLGNRL